MQHRLPLVAIFLSFRVLWGGRSSAPPAVRKWLRPPAVRGLIHVFVTNKRGVSYTSTLLPRSAGEEQISYSLSILFTHM